MTAGDWVHEIGIPCFRPHTRPVKDKEPIVVTTKDLDVILDNVQKYADVRHGGKMPITEGHRILDPEAPEEIQPLTIGYSDNYRRGTLPDGTPAIVCDRHYLPQHADRAKRHPHTSVEYLPKSKAIIGLAKLTVPPQLNVGAVYYVNDEPVYIYGADLDMADEPKDDKDKGKPDPEAKPGEKPAEEPKPDPNAVKAPELTPEEQAGSEKVYAYLCSKYKWMDTCAKKYMNGDAAEAAPPAPASPQGNNTAPPKELGDDDDKNKPPAKKGDDDPEDKPVSNAATLEEVATYKARLEATDKRLADLMAEREREKVDRLLDQLEKVELYQFDREAEASDMIAMTADQRAKRADRIRKYNHKLPGGEQVAVYAGSVEGPVPETSRETADRAVKYATQHGVSYDEALTRVKAGK